MKPETDLPSELAKLVEEPIPAENSAELSTESPSVGYRDADGFYSLDKVMETKKYLNEEVNLDMEKTPRPNHNPTGPSPVWQPR